MDFYAVLDEMVELLRSRGRVSYRALKEHFGLDDERLDALRAELLYAHPGSVIQEEKGLVWTEDDIFAYIADPKAFLTNYNGQPLKNAMAFMLKDEAKRKAAIEGLKEIAACP